MLQVTSTSLFRKMEVLFLGLALFFGTALIVATGAGCIGTPLNVSGEYDPNLQSIRTIDAAVNVVKRNSLGTEPRALADAADGFVRRRFVQGYSEYSPCEDWIAYLAGFVWGDLRNPVLPDDILKHARGACSQQAIVFQSIARRFGLDVGSIRLTGHFIPAVRLGGHWMAYDPYQEISPRSYPLSELLAGDPRIEQLYGETGRGLGMVRQAASHQIRLTSINANPAPQASLFHRLTYFFSHYGWLACLGLFAVTHALRLVAGRRSKVGRAPRADHRRDGRPFGSK